MLNPIQLKNRISMVLYLCMTPCFCFVQRVKNRTSLLVFPKCDCVIIWIPKYFCFSERKFSGLGSRDDVSSSAWPIKVPGTGSQRWDYLSASAGKSVWSKTCTGGMAHWPDPAVPFRERESEGCKKTWSRRKAKWSPRRSRGQRGSGGKLCIKKQWKV